MAQARSEVLIRVGNFPPTGRSGRPPWHLAQSTGTPRASSGGSMSRGPNLEALTTSDRITNVLESRRPMRILPVPSLGLVIDIEIPQIAVPIRPHFGSE